MSAELQGDLFNGQRQNMVERQLRDRGVKDPRVLGAMGRVARHLFVPAEFREHAYEDYPLPIGDEQTVSQPYIVGAMLDALGIEESSVVLEVGTGSGYLTALLAELSYQVYSIERLPRLARSAQAILRGLNYGNVTIEEGDGSLGLPEHAPYDIIVVSAAAPEMPQPLLQQLREGGRMILPVGPAQAQVLELVTKADGSGVSRKLDACRFVPLIGEQGYKTGWSGG